MRQARHRRRRGAGGFAALATLPAIAALAAIAAGGCGRQAPPAPPPPPRHATRPAVRRDVEVTVPFVGRVESARHVELTALTDGRIAALGAADGATVTAGTVLFRLGGPRVEARRQELDAAVAAAGERLSAARAHRARVERRSAAHLAAPDEANEAARELATARQEVADAAARRQAFRAAITVRAPFSGRFSGRRVSAGQEVSEGDLLGDLLAGGGRRVSAALVAGDRSVAPGMAAVVEAADGRTLAARVTGIQAGSSLAGELEVWIGGEALDHLSPGEAVSGRVVVAVHRAAVVVPPAAVVRDTDDHPYVFVGTAPPYTRRPITTGVESSTEVEVTSGLTAGEPVVVEGAYRLLWTDFARRFPVPD